MFPLEWTLSISQRSTEKRFLVRQNISHLHTPHTPLPGALLPSSRGRLISSRVDVQTSGSHGDSRAVAWPWSLRRHNRFRVWKVAAPAPCAALGVNGPRGPHLTAQHYPPGSGRNHAARWGPWWFSGQPLIPGPASDPASGPQRRCPRGSGCEAGGLDATALSEDAGALCKERVLSLDVRSHIRLE